MRYLVAVYSRDKSRLMLLVVLVPILAYVSVLSQTFVKNVIDSLGNVSSFSNSLRWLTFSMVAALILECMVYLLKRKISLNATIFQQTKIEQKLIRGNYESVSDYSKAEIREMWTADVLDIDQMSIDFVAQILVELLTATFALYKLFEISAWMSIAAFLLNLCNLVPVIFIGNQVKIATQEYRKDDVKLTKMFFRIFDHLYLHKSYGNEKNVVSQFDAVGKRYIKSKISKLLLTNFFNTSSRVVSAMIPVAIIILGAVSYRKGVMTIGAIASALALSNSINSPIKDLGAVHVNIKSLGFKIRKVEKFIGISEEANENQEDLDCFSEIKLNHVTVKTEEGRDILRDISLSIQPGEKIALIGESGSGKTCLLKVLSGFLSITDGEMNLYLKDGKKSLKLLSRISTFQNSSPSILNDDVLNNIRYGEVYREGLISEVALHSDGLFDNLHRQISKNVISGGQRRMIGFLRAFNKGKATIFFDECDTGVDRQNAHKMVSYLLNSDKTIIWATHSLENLSKFDRIIVLKNGQIVGNNSFEKIKENDHWKEMVARRENYVAKQ